MTAKPLRHDVLQGQGHSEGMWKMTRSLTSDFTGKKGFIFIQPEFMSNIHRTNIVMPSVSGIKGDLKFLFTRG